MRGYMFRNRWGALLFVALTLAGVTRLVGTESDNGTIQQATSQIARERTASDPREAAPAVAEPPTIIEAPSDEDLIDPATGYDPTPPDPFATDEAPTSQSSDEPPESQSAEEPPVAGEGGGGGGESRLQR